MATKKTYCPHCQAGDLDSNAQGVRLFKEKISNKTRYICCLPCLRVHVAKDMPPVLLTTLHQAEQVTMGGVIRNSRHEFILTAPEGLIETIDIEVKLQGGGIQRMKGFRLKR